tara:strand:- start:45 stop:872 length:828 start_codon:yes stop_codon:yes gene_type:complete
MVAKRPTSVGLSKLKSKLMRPATTSHFLCQFQPPTSIESFASARAGVGFLGASAYNDSGGAELIELSCASASLPGSSLATHEINNDFTGVTERHVYRRQYDERSDFTFYVDHNYRVIDFFENWMSYIVGEDEITDQPDIQQNRQYSYRMNFPNDYKTDNLYITKFEKDYNSPQKLGEELVPRVLTYQFINAFPISINSMPVSYEGSDVLKCTVSFTYSRYVINPRPVAQRQIEFEQALDDATGGSNPIPGTTSLGLTGSGTNRELNNILINQGFA